MESCLARILYLHRYNTLLNNQNMYANPRNRSERKKIEYLDVHSQDPMPNGKKRSTLPIHVTILRVFSWHYGSCTLCDE